MSKKRNKIIDYITDLPGGTRVSVRNIAKELDVSEGTAYSAIKYAEELNLVKTKPRVGTVRLQSETPDKGMTTLTDVTACIQLTILAGAAFANRPISRVIIGDSSLAQFKNEINESSTNTVCIVGDRPDFMEACALKGVNVILTGGAQPSSALLCAAQDGSFCVGSTPQSSAAVAACLCADSRAVNNQSEFSTAEKWMRSPPYLYYNDIAADWYNAYEDIFPFESSCAVVDDDLHICGSITVQNVVTSPTSVKISSLFDQEKSCFTVDETTPMEDIARRMVADKITVAHVSKGGVLSGVVTSKDIIRYFLANPAARDEGSNLPAIELMSSSSSQSVYTVQLAYEKNISNDVMIRLMNFVAKKCCREQFKIGCSFASGTFYSIVSDTPSEFMISCEIRKKTPSGIILGVDIFDEAASYASCTMVLQTTPDDK